MLIHKAAEDKAIQRIEPSLNWLQFVLIFTLTLGNQNKNTGSCQCYPLAS